MGVLSYGEIRLCVAWICKLVMSDKCPMCCCHSWGHEFLPDTKLGAAKTIPKLTVLQLSLFMLLAMLKVKVGQRMAPFKAVH